MQENSTGLLEQIAKIVAEAGGADKDCCHVEKFPCWMDKVEGMYCACLASAEKITRLLNNIPESVIDEEKVMIKGVVGFRPARFELKRKED